MLFIVFPLLLLMMSLFFVSLITMCLDVFHLGFILLGNLSFLDSVDYFLSHIKEVFCYYCFKYFLGSFPSLFSFWYSYNVNLV